MPYAAFADIQSEFKKLQLGASNSVTESEVTEFIVQIDAMINMKLAPRYTTPVTGSESVSILKNISIALVAYRVANILNLRREVPLPDGRVAQTLNYTAPYKAALKLLEDIFEGEIDLPDATLLTSGSGLSSYNVDNDINSLFTRDTRQW